MATSEDFAVAITRQDDHATVEVRGELDAATGPTLSDAVAELTNDSLASVVIDLDNVTFVDSRGLNVLLELHRQAVNRAMAFSVVNVRPPVDRLFRISGVDAVLLDGEPLS
jgi:anti-sigma B factor antagonist